MSDTVISFLGASIALGVLIGVAYALDRRRKTRGEEPDKGDRKVFYFSVGLYVGGIFLIGVGAVYGSLAVITIGGLTFISAWVLRWAWRFRKIK
jgi:hypothetical protein